MHHKITTLIFDMYGVILKERTGNFIPYTFEHFEKMHKYLSAINRKIPKVLYELEHKYLNGLVYNNWNLDYATCELSYE